ncbi:MAG TPA: hypothetical protein VIY48_06475 [Candidatus Paceibacterota bacterium]
MINQRDIGMFFYIIDVLRDPERMTQELKVLQNKAIDLEEREKALAEAEKVVALKHAQANSVLASQKTFDDKHAMRTKQVEEKVKDAAGLAEKANDLIKHNEALSDRLLNRSRELDKDEAQIKAREEIVARRESQIAGREEALKSKEADYQTRMNKLKAITA